MTFVRSFNVNFYGEISLKKIVDSNLINFKLIERNLFNFIMEGGIRIFSFAFSAFFFDRFFGFWCFQPYWTKPIQFYYGGGHWNFQLCGFGFFFDRFFGFWCSSRFADFSFFSIWFSVFVIDTSGFQFWYAMWLSVFPILSYRFLFDLSKNWPRICRREMSR